MTPPSGADGVVDEDGSLRGHIFFHLGDDSPRRTHGQSAVTLRWPPCGLAPPPHPPPYEELEPGLSRHVARQLGARSTVAVLVFELPLAESPAPILKTEPINSRVGPSLRLCRGY